MHFCQPIPMSHYDTYTLGRSFFRYMSRERDSYNFLDTYLLFLDEEDQTKLKEFGIQINSPSFKKPLFNYPSFIKTLDTYRVELHTINWINNLGIDLKLTGSTNQGGPTFFPTESTLEIKNKDSKKIIDFVYIPLFKSFMN